MCTAVYNCDKVKTKIIKVVRKRKTKLNVEGRQIKEMASFRYLENLISNNETCTKGIKVWIKGK